MFVPYVVFCVPRANQLGFKYTNKAGPLSPAERIRISYRNSTLQKTLKNRFHCDFWTFACPNVLAITEGSTIGSRGWFSGPGQAPKIAQKSLWAIFVIRMSEKDITKSAASGIAKLDRTNYVQWCIDVQLLLEEKGIWSFALGKQEEPPATASAQEKSKFAKDKAKSRAIILQSLVPCLQPAAMKCDTTQAVWQHLKKLFEPSSIAREASLVETFYGICRLENEELDTFVSRLEKAENDLIAANVKLKPEDQIKAYILLSRIGKDFELQIQSIYQWQKDNFTFEMVLEALLLENNCRKLVAVSKMSSEAVQAFSSKSKVSDLKTSADESYLQKITCFKCNQQGHFTRDCVQNASVSQDPSYLDSMTCYTCGKTGHMSCQCPDDYALRGGRSFRGRSRGRSSRKGGNTPGQPSSNVTSAWFVKVVDSGPVSVHPMGLKRGYLVGYGMRKMGYRVWDPNSNVIYELNKVVCNERELFGNTRKTGNIQTEGNQEVEPYHDPGVSSDSEDDDVTPSAPITKQVSVKADDVIGQSTSTITMRQKSSSVSERPPKGILKTPVMSKPAWELVEVERQSGTSKGRKDIYFYPPNSKLALRSVPEMENYFKSVLKERYDPHLFNWKPTP
uniref:CCHC-type domain-containing protein n=1 Tax=Strigamia maritima TaxID=126957 RepID=T1IZ03_STRMM